MANPISESVVWKREVLGRNSESRDTCELATSWAREGQFVYVIDDAIRLLEARFAAEWREGRQKTWSRSQLGTRHALFRCALPLLFIGTLSGCNFGHHCLCPAASAAFAVYGAPDGGVVQNVDAVLTGVGDSIGQGNCTLLDHYAMETTCQWYAGSLDSGSYTIQITAPGYQTANVPVTLTVSPPVPGAACSCGGGALIPNSVVLTPGDGGP
jgi:hypothetical protein